MKFGVKDYWMMLKKRGWRLPLYYFVENHLFDIRHGTQTHVWLPKEDYTETPVNFEHGVLYMCSWTSVVKAATDVVLKDVGGNVDDCAFVDIGCGKGKVLCVWSLNYRNSRHAKLVGIDYSESLLSVCRSNLEKIGARNYKIINDDASTLDYDFGMNRNIYYLYNPFDEVILRDVVDRLKKKNCYVIYNNPLHLDVFLDSNFEVLHEEKSWHPNGDYIVLKVTHIDA